SANWQALGSDEGADVLYSVSNDAPTPFLHRITLAGDITQIGTGLGVSFRPRPAGRSGWV
ncbi:MAG: hypothetical protein MI784_12785, partial [Cytophagales bacterium]|nr:hypothetical protein [Cytophagales bacterium]